MGKLDGTVAIVRGQAPARGLGPGYAKRLPQLSA
jgi:hypothetical protein